jgi:hypothetical protein
MIVEIKNILQEVVEQRCPGVPVARSVLEESRMIMARKLPFITLTTNRGNFDDREAKTFRYYEEASQTFKQRYVRGNRSVPIILWCWAEGEEAADKLFSRILPAIPRKFTYDGFDGLILISGEEHSDHADTVSKVYASVVEIKFTVSVALEAEEVPTIRQTELDIGANRL